MDWNGVLKYCAEKAESSLGKGKVADYIPALAKADPSAFAMAVIDLEGEAASIGDATTPFSIQSISKVFTLSMALSKRKEKLWRRVGREPSGSAFNSIVQLEHENGMPRNPLINAGALCVTDTILSDHETTAAASIILERISVASESSLVSINDEVATSEEKWGDRNRALAYFMKAFDRLENNPADVLRAPLRCQCVISRGRDFILPMAAQTPLPKTGL